MTSRLALRFVFATLTVGALCVTVAVNRARPSEIKFITKSLVQAVIKQGGGTLVTPSFTTRYSRADIVVFDSPNCGDLIFAMPAAFGDGAFLVLESIPDLKLEAYEPQLAYKGDIGAPVGAVLLQLQRIFQDLSAQLSGAETPYSRSAIYFLVPRACDIRNTIAWQDIWNTP